MTFSPFFCDPAFFHDKKVSPARVSRRGGAGTHRRFRLKSPVAQPGAFDKKILTSIRCLHYNDGKTRTQIQLPELLFGKLKRIARTRDLSVAEVIRRGMEFYVQTCADPDPPTKPWTLPVLRGSGGHLLDPASIKAEASAIEQRCH